MLNKIALYYHKKGYNCSQCILKACEEIYNIKCSEETLNLCSAINNGFGIGSMCSVLIAGIMVFGLLFEENTAKKLRLKLLLSFKEKHSLDCISLKKEFNNKNCDKIIEEISNIIENLINEEKRINKIKS